MRIYAVVRLESFDCEKSFLHCGNENQDFLYCVIRVDESGFAEAVDSGYHSYEEAIEAWPEASITAK